MYNLLLTINYDADDYGIPIVLVAPFINTICHKSFKNNFE